LARAHAENLLNEVGDIKGVPLLAVEECRLLLAPGVHVGVIRCHRLLPFNARHGLSRPSLEEGICTIVSQTNPIAGVGGDQGSHLIASFAVSAWLWTIHSLCWHRSHPA